VIEQQLDALSRKLPHRWWTPWALGAGALVLGLALSRLPFLKLVGTGARTVQTGINLAGTVAAVDRILADRRDRRLAA
jgi:hypothetical protein